MFRRWGILFSAFMVLWCAHAGAATISITTLADEQNINGQCSLREALLNANHDNQWGSLDCPAGSGADIIVFSDNLTGTVTLGSPLPSIDQNLTIKGRSNWTIEISGNYAVGVFKVSPGLTVNLRDLVIAKGSVPNGGGVRNSGSDLNIEHCRFTENSARYGTYGGGIQNYNGTVNIVDSEFLKNWADIGGGIDSNRTLNITKCTFQGNEARIGSGINNSGKADIADSKFEANKIKHSGGGISNSGELIVRNSTFTGHETDTGQGGGISNVAKADLNGVTIKGNRAGLGGGIVNSGTLQLTGTTIEENRAECSGGGIFNSENGKLEIKGEKGGCKISRNKAVNGGGGIYNGKGAVTISGSEITGNHTESGLGGGIFTYDGSLEIHTTIISHNSAAQNGGGLYSLTAATLGGVAFAGNVAYASGGGAYLDGARTHMVDVAFEKNEAKKDGGGIYNAGTLKVEKGIFSSNENSGFGSGIFNESIAEVVSSTFGENLSISGGGGIYNTGPLTITGCTFFRNGAGGNGGAIYNKYIKEDKQEVKIINSTLSGNMTDSKGGGIFNEGTEATVISSTLSDNTALGQRGNIYNKDGLVKLQNALIAGKSPGNNCTGTYTSLGYNLSSDGSCGLTQATDLTNTDPLIGALTDNGGFTETHALLTGSPAINKIPTNVNGCGTSIVTDQRGTARPQPSTGNCDIGAYEKKPWLDFRPPIHKVK